MTPDARTRALHYSLRFATALAIIAIPVLLVTSSLRFAINAGGLYEYDFNRYDISLRTGIPDPELSRIGEEIRDYFNDDSELIDIDAAIYGDVQPLFTEREIIHMKDVKGLNPHRLFVAVDIAGIPGSVHGRLRLVEAEGGDSRIGTGGVLGRGGHVADYRGVRAWGPWLDSRLSSSSSTS